jgi:hypothetical protein
MAQYIQVGNEVVEFPDDMSDDQIAAVLKGSESAPQEAPAAQQPSMVSELGRQLGLTARAGITGLSAVPNAVADFASGAANLGLQAVGSDRRVPYLSQLQQQALDQTLPTPRPGLEQKVQTGAEAVAGMMTPGMRLPMASQAEGATARQVVGRGMSEAAATATGAIVGQSAAQQAQELTGSPWAALAAGLATGTVAGSAVGKTGFALTGPRQEPVTIDQIRQRASRSFEAVDNAGVAVRTDTLKNKLMPNIESELRAANYDPDIVSAHKPIQENLKLFQQITDNKIVDFRRLEKIRSTFSGLAQGTDDTARLANVVKNEIDSYLGNISPKDTLVLSGQNSKEVFKTLENARKDWRNQSRAQVLQDILDSSTARMEGTTGPTGDVLKAKLVNLTSNVEKMKQFSSREQNVIKAAAQSTDLDSLLSLLSKFNPQRGFAQTAGLGGAATAATTGQGATAVMGGIGLGMAGSGYLADKALASMRQREMKNLIGQIASGNLQTPKQGFAVPGLFGATMGATP